jgi:anti-anti-sigma regulatory factor
VTLKIEKLSRGQKTIIRLIGRIQSDHLEELTKQMAGDRPTVALDLDGVTLVDVDVVRFLSVCEESGIELLHCWPYIREWMVREKDREG